MRSNVDYDFKGNQLRQAVLERQPTATPPQFRGQIAFDDTTGKMRYSPDGVNWAYGAEKNFSVGAPVTRIRTGSTGWSMCGDGFTLPSGSRNHLGLKAANVPSEFFTDKSLNAGIDLYIYRGQVHDNSQSQNDQDRFTHPVSVRGSMSEDEERVSNGIIPSRSMHRGSAENFVKFGPLAGERQTFWPLYGANEGSWIAKDVNLTGHLRVGQIEVFEKSGAPSSINAYGKGLGPLASGRYAITTKQTKHLYRTIGVKGFALYVAFAYSWRDFSHPDKRARVCGPMSRILRVSAYPYPVYEDWATGKAAARDGFSFEVKAAR